MTLIELLVGLAVAAIVAASVMTAFAATGRAMQRHRSVVDIRDAAQVALAAVAADLVHAEAWRMCSEARDCFARSGQRSGYRRSMLLAGDVDWLVEKGLRRCVKDRKCDVFATSVIAMEVFADMQTEAGSIRRTRLLQWHGDSARSLEVVLTTSDGRRFSRVVTREEKPARADG